jgi:hypothetical protein
MRPIQLFPTVDEKVISFPPGLSELIRCRARRLSLRQPHYASLLQQLPFAESSVMIGTLCSVQLWNRLSGRRIGLYSQSECERFCATESSDSKNRPLYPNLSIAQSGRARRLISDLLWRRPLCGVGGCPSRSSGEDP